MEREDKGAAERIVQAVLGYTDHMYHGRPGCVVQANGMVRWSPVTHSVENGVTNVYETTKVGRKTTKRLLGQLRDDGKTIFMNGRKVGEYRKSGLFTEIVVKMYEQIAEIWKMDNALSAHWASYAFGQDHRDLKVALAAFMLVQTRRGDPVIDSGQFLFNDEDYRDVGEAMILLHTKGKMDLNPKLLLRVRSVLMLPEIAKINRDFGFGNSKRKPFLGRWSKAVTKWLEYREKNPKMLAGLVKAGFRKTVIRLARLVGYKPASPRFFETLRWKQKQAGDGRREIAIGVEVRAAESWEGLTEEEICERIVKTRPNFKRLVGFLPEKCGLTRAIVAAAIEAGSMSDKDLVIATPTLEEMGLLGVPEIKLRWERAIKAADDMRAANIATRVRSKETKEVLVQAADNALQKAAAEVMKNLRVYFLVDKSGSMHQAIDAAKIHLAKFLQAFPQEQLHVCAFNTVGHMIEIKHASAAGVEHAFKGVQANGGTDYASGVYKVGEHLPKEDEDAIFIFYGDEQNGFGRTFEASFDVIGFKPVAFGLVRVGYQGGQRAVEQTAANLGIPCLKIDEETFADPYAIPRTIRNLIAATPVGVTTRQAPQARVALIDTILKTPLLAKPAWAA